MYGALEFGKIWGTQIASQALASFLILGMHGFPKP